MTLLSILLIGFLLGAKHAFESDHLAAVATLATGRQSVASTLRQGIAWGVGHTVTLLIVGGAVLAFGTAIPHRLEQALELCVGLMLVALGFDVIRRFARQRVHFHVHQHGGGRPHFHAHSHDRGTTDPARLPDVVRADRLPRLELDHADTPHDHEHLPIRAFAVGTMHGLAGSAALVVLSLGSVQSVTLGLGYIVLFGFGSIAGMAVLSLSIAIPLRLSRRVAAPWYRGMAAAIGALTFGLGAWIVYSIGFVDGLFIG